MLVRRVPVWSVHDVITVDAMGSKRRVEAAFVNRNWLEPSTDWKTLKSTIRGKMAFVTKQTSSIVHVAINLISFLVICTRADVTSECANVATCIGTYADIYNSLASDESSFNIESALYPANEPSSVLVFVNLCGQNGSDKACDNSTPGVKKYTWSLRSLYAAFPPLFLEISSLFSILVTPRTKHLNITIPPFCCNVSEEDREKMIKNVLASLQDLAVLPGLRDPRLNFAESVIEGHILDMKASGRSYTRQINAHRVHKPVLVGQSFYGRETADDILKTAFLSVIGAVSWLSFKSRKVSSNSSQCIEAANKAADAAKELAAKITELQPDGTGIHSAIVAATTAACNSASAAAAAATAVAAALAETGRNENTTPNGNELGEEGLPLRSNRRPSPQ
ncbi:hypothetical protein AWC38_SpisGene12176 [Stylophora pistillata]|uniref:Uncharacterized protein n=1 Tax=Stylophora pistillata TaxID=50429 RepID=A0A2B4S3D6_STYPI|nr:hypothetical protein AWC38_SpisGene12176 [Stylophora pistillata]